MDPKIAYLISDILSDRYARMHAFGLSSVLDVDRPAAAKTGTTSDWRDNWTVGYTPDRAVGVWVGNADGQPMEGISGISGAGPVWHEVMLAAHRGLQPRPFTRPAGIVEVAICAEGGLLPGPYCPGTRLERFVAGTQPARADDTHVRVAIDPALGCRAPAGYPLARAVPRTFRILPAGAEAWAVTAGLTRMPQQVCSIPTKDEGRRTNAEGDSVSLGPVASSELTPALLRPAPGAVFTVSPGVPRERQRIVLSAQAGDGAARLTIYVDGQPLATFDRPPYRVFWQLVPGTHRALVEVADQQGKKQKSEEVRFVVEP